MNADQTTGRQLIQWFKNAGCTLNDSIGIALLPGMGRGIVALQDIPENTTLFTIPRDTLLSTRTSSLRKLLSPREWKSLGSGWQPLILSMMWEESRGEDSPWSGYLRDMPTAFDTLMFWSENELEALQASTIREKIGRAEAENDYHQRIRPILQKRPDIFNPQHLDTYFTLERYHINGSRILSRSFQVEEWSSEESSNGNESDAPEQDRAMEEDVPELIEVGTHPDSEDAVLNEEVGSDENEEDVEVDDVTMVPMADILNARQGCNNAKLYHEKDYLRMVTIRDIKAGEQIWNTYGDPPNSELLRRYGYIDLLPCEKNGYAFPFENPSDEVEIRADLVIDIVAPSLQGDERMRKIDTWLGLGGDDTFALDKDDMLCKPMLGLIRFLSMSESEVAEAIEKEKLPKGKAFGDALSKASSVFRARLSQYSTSIQEDEAWLENYVGTPNRLYNATFVRLCEKRLLNEAITKAEAILKVEAPSQAKPKRTRPANGAQQGQKKAKR